MRFSIRELTLLTACTLTLIILAASASAQFPYHPALPAPPPPSPLMYLRFTGPPGSKITIYRGVDQGQILELPLVLGFRPGYSYRFAVSDLPNLPRRVFYPSLEVRGSLALLPKMRNADFPAHINFTEEEFGKTMQGIYVKKVVTLERPDQALPIATKADMPIEIQVTGSRDPVVEAAERGQPLVVYHVGQRFISPQELNALAIPGTVLLPGERVLGAPRHPPYLLWNWFPVYDPIYGPRHPSEFVTLYDGGDIGMPIGISRDRKLKGLDATDTVGEYTDSRGIPRVAVSNRVGICVPRFILFRGEYALGAQVARLGLENKLAVKAPASSVGMSALTDHAQQQHSESVRSQLRLSGTFQSLATSATGRVQGLEIKSSLKYTATVDAIKNKPRDGAADEPDGPLVIFKWPEKSGVNVGEVVTFFLKYSNSGGQPITNVVVSDSLGARFEYVKGSARTDRDALFTTQPNEVASTVLRWEFTSPLPPREHGLISFQVRVR